jgi:hypothetical protein
VDGNKRTGHAAMEITLVLNGVNVSNPYFCAKSTLVTPAGPSAAVPGPLPVLGAAASFCFSRKLRKRIKPSANSADGTLGA